MRYAIQHGWTQADPAPSLKGAFKAAPSRHMTAITAPQRFGQLLRDIDQYSGTPSVMTLLPLVFCRPGELRRAKWAEIDLQKAE